MATTNTNIKINIVEPGSSTPVDPTPIDPADPSDTTNTTTYTTSTDVSVPDTGLFTHGIGGTEATIITITSIALLLTILATIVTVLYKKHIKQGKVTKLVRIVDQVKTIVKSKKRITASLTALALLISIATLSTLLINTNKSNTNAIESTGGNESSESSEMSEEGNEESTSTLTLDVDSEELTIEVGDEPVFAVLPVKLTVEEVTQAGYTLTAYTDSTDLVSTTNPDNVIPMVAINEEDLSEYTSLTDNTWGLSLAEPETKGDEVYIALSTDTDNPTIITDKDYEGTGENDKTTIYYGFYITPDTPKGTYEGSVINYEAKENTATVVFDGNGKFYFDGDTATTTNTMSYIPGNNETHYSHTPNVNDEGVQDGMYPLDSNETFVYEFSGVDNVYVYVVRTGNDNSCGPDRNDYFSIWSGAHSDYTAKANWETALSLKGSDGKNVFDNVGEYDGVGVNVEGDSVTIAYTTSDYRATYCVESGYGYYAKVIGYNPNIVTSGEYKKPATDGAYRFLGWSEDKDATTPTYKSAADIERAPSLKTGETVTLYAISEPGFVISYNGNGADSTTNMDNIEQYTTDLTSTEKQVDLLASNFTKSGHGFVGWSTDQNAWEALTDDDESNNPTIYGPNQMITVDPSASTKLNLYAVWAPAETDNSGNPISLQDWQGCSTLTTTTYNTETGQLTVGKNTITALTDSRDGNIYTVARLADGNCWMTENLRVDNNPELSQQNTNNPSLPLTNNYTEQTTSNSLSATSNDWCKDYDSAPCYNQSKLNTNNTALTTTSPALSQDYTNEPHNWRTGNLEANISSYSNYYNWYSATAGNGKYKTVTTVAGDICPAGWRLPIGNQTSANGSFSHLDTSMGGTGRDQDSTEASNRWRSFPNNFVYSGQWYGSSAHGRGDNGYYLSSTAEAVYGTSAYYLRFYSGSVRPGTNTDSMYSGYSVRCVAPAQ